MATFFNEESLRAAVAETWGAHGAHAEVLDDLIKRSKIVTKDEFKALFDKSNPHWQTIHEKNQVFVQVNTNYLNHVLKVKGFLFLNDAYEAFGFPATREGQLVGWTSDESNQIKVEFWDVYGDAFTLKFKVQGEIWQKLPPAEEPTRRSD